MDSLKVASKFAGGLGALCVGVGTLVVALKAFTVVWLVALGVITIASGAIAYAVSELSRLSRHSKLLGDLLQSEKYYESLLSAAREERRAAEQSASAMQSRLDIVMGVREIIRVERAGNPEPVAGD
jgi:hypothetical protein